MTLFNDEKKLHEDTKILLSVEQEEKISLKSDIDNLKKENQETVSKINTEVPLQTLLQIEC